MRPALVDLVSPGDLEDIRLPPSSQLGARDESYIWRPRRLPPLPPLTGVTATIALPRPGVPSYSRRLPCPGEAEVPRRRPGVVLYIWGPEEVRDSERPRWCSPIAMARPGLG